MADRFKSSALTCVNNVSVGMSGRRWTKCSYRVRYAYDTLPDSQCESADIEKEYGSAPELWSREEEKDHCNGHEECGVDGLEEQPL